MGTPKNDASNDLPLTDPKREAMAQAVALTQTGTNLHAAAKAAGVPRNTLRAAKERIERQLMSGNTDTDTRLREIDDEVLNRAVSLNAIAAQNLENELLDGNMQGREAAYSYAVTSKHVEGVRAYKNADPKTDGAMMSKVLLRLAEMAPEGGSAEIQVTVSASSHSSAQNQTDQDLDPDPIIDIDPTTTDQS